MSPIAVPRNERDIYANLLRDTRGLRREQAAARDSWFASLPWIRKEETLFELEMLLKGIACFGNSRNHPGPPADENPSVQDFHEELLILREAFVRVVALARALLGDREQAYTFTRYIETVLPGDAARGRLIQDQLTQNTPEESLFVLRNSFGHFADLADGLQGVGRISSRLYTALHGIVVREIGRNAFFNPLMALEFRHEFDRIRVPEVLDGLDAIESENAHRIVALTFLALFRGLRYLALIEDYSADPGSVRRAYVILAAFRSDLRTLTQYLLRRAADVIADGLERELLEIPAADLRNRYTWFAELAGRLARIRAILENLGSTLQTEVSKVFEVDLPPPRTAMSASELGARLVGATADLRASIHHAIRALCAELRPGQPLPELVTDPGSRRAASDRLRREIWMFMQVLRAFVAKAEAAEHTHAQEAHDRWTGQANFQFVRDFLRHFRAIGYQLVRSHDYHRLDPLLSALERVRDVDLLEPTRMREAVAECREFLAFLSELFEQVSGRAELAGAEFDRRAATNTLKIYLRRD